MFFVMIWWLASAHKWFKGPKVNLEHMMYGREDQLEQIDGKDGDLERDSGSDSGNGNKKATYG